MPFFLVTTQMGYCGTDEEHYIEAESEIEAEMLGQNFIDDMVSVDVEEIDEEEYLENEGQSQL